jgi:hypothetical protein
MHTLMTEDKKRQQLAAILASALEKFTGAPIDSSTADGISRETVQALYDSGLFSEEL